MAGETKSGSGFFMGIVKWLAAVLPAAVLGVVVTALVIRFAPTLWSRLSTPAPKTV